MSRNTYAVQQLLVKMKNPDSDLRFMALTDLMSEIARNKDSFGTDDATEHSTVELVLSLMNDTNGEVKNLAVKTLAALIKQVTEHRIQTIIDKLVTFTASKDEGVRDIASLGLKTVVTEIDSSDSSAALRKTVCTRLAPKVVQQLENSSSSSELLIDALDLMTDIVTRFEGTVKSLPQLQTSILKASTNLLSHARPAVRKRAINVLAKLVPAAEPAVFTSLVEQTLVPMLKDKDVQKQKTAVALAGALARSSPRQMGSKTSTILPVVLASSSTTPPPAKGAAAEVDEDLVELSLQSLEAFVLRCPTEAGPSLNDIIAHATGALKYDPNYAGGGDDDDDESMLDDDDEQDEELEDDFADEYSDEDETSWKVRRAATKLLSACIATRQDLLGAFLKSIAPALVSRFDEREETVKVDVWATYTLLLDQLQTSGQLAPSFADSRANTPTGSARALKRKRSVTDMDVEETPLATLQSQAPAVAKSIVKQLNAKSLATRSAGFVLLHSLVRALQGGLEAQVALLVNRIETSLKASESTGITGAATSLRIEILTFLSLFVKTHSVTAYADHLSDLVAMLVTCVNDRLNRVAAEALVTCTELVKVLRPAGSASPATPTTSDIQKIYDAVAKRLASTDADEDVRTKGLFCLGQILACSFDVLGKEGQQRGLDILAERLKSEVTRLTAVQVTSVVASSTELVKGKAVDTWAAESLVEISPFLRKVHRPLKLVSFGAIRSLVKVSSSVNSDILEAVLGDLQTLLAESDVVVLSNAISTISTVVASASSLSSEPLSIVESDIVPRATKLVVSPLLQGPALSELVSLFATLVHSSSSVDAASLVDSIAGAAKGSDLAGASNAAQCVGAIAREDDALASKLKKDYVKTVKDGKATPGAVVFALHVIGEVGRAHALEKKSFDSVLALFASDSDDVRRAAAFAAGNCAVGNPEDFLQPIVQLVRADDKQRMLALQSLKELITHSSTSTLGQVSDELWTPLFENCEAPQDEMTRNIAADCLGQITVVDPQKYLPQLQTRLTSDSKDTRATVISAIRYTFTNDSTLYDELLAPLVVEFFKLIHDADLGVRRLALSALNSAAHNKPHLLKDDLSTLLAELYKQTQVDESLIRMVEMGPFKHKVDDGLDIRKTAYECMHTLLESSFKDIDLHAFIGQVVEGLNDDEEVKKLCYLMLVKLAAVAPTATAQKLDDGAIEPLQATLNTTLKDNAVKQETERLAELQKSCLRCISALDKISSAASTPKFEAFVQSIKTGKWSSEYADVSVSTSHQMTLVDAMDTD